MRTCGKRLLGGLLATVLLTGMAAGTANGTVRGDPAACLDSQEAAFLRLINDYRAQHGVGELTAVASLNRASYDHSADMAENGYFDHDSQDGRTPEDRMAEAGYDTDTSTGENIAAGYPDAEEVFQTWRDSPGHNENMLDEDFTAIGIGLATVDGSEYTEYWTTDFGGQTEQPRESGPHA